MERIRITNLICTALVTGTLLAACSGGSSEADALPTRKATAASVAAARAKAKADQHNAELVSGVTLGKPGAPVDLKFELGAKPVVGVQLPITIELTPRAPIGRLQVTVQGSEGIELAPGTELEPVDRPTPDAVITRTFTVTPKREGVFYIPVIAYANEASSSTSRSFAVPIIVGTGGAAALAQKPATEVAAGDGLVERMPAQESGGPH